MLQPQRFMPSVSDLYGPDEIEFLLDEIPELEPACCQIEDIQDFEIAGSRADLTLSLESPLGTVTSWNSHAHYQKQIGHHALPWGVSLHCDASHLKTPTGIVRVLLVLSSVVCLACECSAGTVQVGLFLLPLIGRLRFMVFCALFSLLVTCLLIFLDISHLAYVLPFNWTKINGWLYLTISLTFVIGASLLMHMVLFAEAFSWVPRHTKDTLLISAITGYICGIESLVLSALTRCQSQYSPVKENDSDFCIQERELTPIGPTTTINTTEVVPNNAK